MTEPASPASATNTLTDPPDGTRDSYVLENQIGYLLRRGHQRASAIFSANLADLNLTPTQLAALAKIRDEGQVSQNLLGRLTAMDPATMQGVIKRLGDRGLITRTADTIDRRRTLLALTEEGLALLEDAVPRGLKTSVETLGPLSPRERETFLRLLEKLV